MIACANPQHSYTEYQVSTFVHIEKLIPLFVSVYECLQVNYKCLQAIYKCLQVFDSVFCLQVFTSVFKCIKTSSTVSQKEASISTKGTIIQPQ